LAKETETGRVERKKKEREGYNDKNVMICLSLYSLSEVEKGVSERA